jgi:serine phosphatase RsbU (regulator of sigma subunit)
MGYGDKVLAVESLGGFTHPVGQAASLAKGILEDVMSFQRGTPRDDFAVVVVQVPLPG